MLSQKSRHEKTRIQTITKKNSWFILTEDEKKRNRKDRGKRKRKSQRKDERKNRKERARVQIRKEKTKDRDKGKNEIHEIDTYIRTHRKKYIIKNSQNDERTFYTQLLSTDLLNDNNTTLFKYTIYFIFYIQFTLYNQ